MGNTWTCTTTEAGTRARVNMRRAGSEQRGGEDPFLSLDSAEANPREIPLQASSAAYRRSATDKHIAFPAEAEGGYELPSPSLVRVASPVPLRPQHGAVPPRRPRRSALRGWSTAQDDLFGSNLMLSQSFPTSSTSFSRGAFPPRRAPPPTPQFVRERCPETARRKWSSTPSACLLVLRLDAGPPGCRKFRKSLISPHGRSPCGSNRVHSNAIVFFRQRSLAAVPPPFVPPLH